MSSEQWCDQSQPPQSSSDLYSNTYNNNGTSGGNSSDSDLQSPTTQLRLPQQPQHNNSNGNNSNEKDSLEASFPHHQHDTSSTTQVPNFLDNPSLTHPHQYPTNFYPSQSYSGGGVGSEGGQQMRVDDNTGDSYHHEGVQGKNL